MQKYGTADNRVDNVAGWSNWLRFKPPGKMGILFANHDKCKNMATQPTGWTTLQVGSPTRQMTVLSRSTVILIAI